jgi:uncharacterized protein DUF4304
MRAIVASVAPALKTAGFRKRRHAFNREVGPLTHVVSFQMGAFDPSAAGAGVPFRPNLYGRFTVNLGVFALELLRTAPRAGDWVNDYDCQFRMRIGHLLSPAADTWWALDDPDVPRTVELAIEQLGLPWLDRLGSCDAIIAAFLAGERASIGTSPAAAVDVAQLLLAGGRRAEAEAVARDYLATDLAPTHRAHVTTLLGELGLAVSDG